ncbi:MAG TPA: Co2+/Mg2+ efflux protein ApaG [Edaphocola sp.]|nr:Co2+/Mg2+ efflux protein ApaG [Edaphocola sp.]
MGIIQQITDGVSISVLTSFQEGYSNPKALDFLFSYEITIENLSVSPVRLLRRHWYILDSIGTRREVDGEGVIGQQPLLYPGEQFTYVSAVNIQSEMGRMTGYYTMENLHIHKLFSVTIPEFELIAPLKMN